MSTYSWATNFVIGESRAMRKAIALTDYAGKTEAPVVLITGETGAGKELFARGVHACSNAAHEPFVVINCATLSGAAFERELFGAEVVTAAGMNAADGLGAKHVKRGLLEFAEHGTLFLDEINALSPPLQRTLLQVLERRSFHRVGGQGAIPVNARIVAASTASLEEAVGDGTFGPKLLEQLAAVRIDLPSLRDREGDVALLAHYFLERIAIDTGTKVLKLSLEALTALNHHSWPGNVRELKNVMERAALVCTGDTIQRRHLMFQRRCVATDAGEVNSIIQIPTYGKTLDAITSEAIHVTLVLTQGNLSATARILGISRPTLARKIRETGLGSSVSNPPVESMLETVHGSA